ncbi:hypothetical protein NPS01_39780 [Nocardioides psychrotolerans]|uniref:Thrombospondin type 3 repeat-containing protein n=1 Tax=Nocardioides psychrotolerans TaxID=1005945 RepID=A0A1I3R5K5_9ACTN|nr:hypothetical protein [Nocardioides psychrotolerans]GEP40315.1 hypothetical protein NPS01_39780 [Nocardioides psychrotolerans]SFJ40721.1 hypothetical protein SAMN05216561_12927 [Nocardioides psychrotolerans]
MRRLLTGALLLPLALGMGMGALPTALADAPADSVTYDTFDSVTYNPEGPGGTELPVTRAFAFVTPAGAPLDTTSFTVQPGEAAAVDNHNGCVVAPGEAAYAGRTAWVRFDPAVDGQLLVRAITPGYDSVMVLHQTPDVTWGQADLSTLQNTECASNDPDAGNETIGSCNGVPCLPVGAGLVYYMQVGGRCPSSTDPSTCTRPDVPGGSTRIEIRFVPDDSDGDGVPDTEDQCVGGLPGDVNAAGCPDQDHDGLADTDDACPTAAGNPDPPFDGCPEGPVPPDPDGPVDVTIVALDGDRFNTQDVRVNLRLNWPQGATSAVASNGDGAFRPIPLQAVVPWELEPSPKSESREVKVVFSGAVPTERDRDTITLDPVAPRLAESFLVRTASGWNLALKMTDDRSGVLRVRVLDGAGGSIAGRVFCSPGSGCRLVREDRFKGLDTRPRTAVVQDAAGNDRRVRLVARQSSCSGNERTVLSKLNVGRLGCFFVGERVTRSEAREYDWADAELRLKRLSTRRFRVQRLVS